MQMLLEGRPSSLSQAGRCACAGLEASTRNPRHGHTLTGIGQRFLARGRRQGVSAPLPHLAALRHENERLARAVDELKFETRPDE